MGILHKWTKKILVYCIGIFIISIAISLSKISNLGVSPSSSIPCVISNITGIAMGTCSIAVLCVFVLLQVLILRKDFNPINILQILCSTLFGMFLNLTNAWLGSCIPQPQNYFVAFFMLCISIVLLAIGVVLYLQADIMLLPSEGIMQALVIKTKLKTSTCKMIVDCTAAGTSVILSLVFLGRLDGVREGTILTAFGVGATMKVVSKYIKEPLKDFLYGKQY